MSSIEKLADIVYKREKVIESSVSVEEKKNAEMELMALFDMLLSDYPPDVVFKMMDKIGKKVEKKMKEN